ncbi:hypothetical protein JDN40_06825 [Rhodomicrobium vannielii ATCC 17100]|uniref:hypothetical protein n=1 Tax=Rhodomicrobium vannielii TaxID=1069 RepID=UPI00191B82E5|nr:hypothetical protein [Rhodomicrobium vannielii]MBJ7533813.1 hypothetical protein [Rhodomicrobium vannielii ATCC 17100]
MRALSVALAFAMMGGLSACAFDREGAPELHFADFKGEPPRKNSIWICHAYGCQQKTKVTFGAQQRSEIAALMAKTKKADTPHEERRATAYMKLK